MPTRPVGKTRDAGWQIGVSRSIAVDLETVWHHLISPAGLAVWLGPGLSTPLVKGERYETADGTTGEVRSLRPLDRVRLTWQPVDRADDATVQVAVTPSKAGCSLRFHTERLYDGEERERMRHHWRQVVDRIEAELTPEVS
ncbi:MAG: SRPBCC domain-containing protein [Actinomycetota bacterium]